MRVSPGAEPGDTKTAWHGQYFDHRTAEHRCTPAQLRRRREASWRCEPLPCGCRDPWICRCYPPLSREGQSRPVPFVMLSVALAALRRAWLLADDGDRVVLADIAAVLTEIAESGEAAA